MAYDIFCDPPDGLAEALMEGSVDEVTRILQKAGDDFPIFHYIYGEGVKDCQTLNDPTALTLATEYGHMDCVKKILLELGHDAYAFGVELDYEYRETAEIPDDYFAALILAATKGYKEIFQLLIDFRLFKTPGIADTYAEFVTAAKQGDFLRIENLLDEVGDKDNFLKGWKGHNIMNVCLLYGCPSRSLQKMIDLGIGVNGWDYNGLTPLMCAIIGKNLDCVQFLLDKGADPYAPHIKHCESFQADGAITYDQTKPFIQPSCTVGIHRHIGPCALMYAAAMGHIPILKLMLKAAPGDIGTSGRLKSLPYSSGPLDFAISYGSMESINLILQYKAARENVRSETFHLSIERDDMVLFEILLEKIPPLSWTDTCVRDVLYDSVGRNNHRFFPRLCKSLGDRFFEVDIHYNYQICLDHWECIEGFSQIPGFKIDDLYCEGETCFMYSCQKGRLEIAGKLLKMGADINMVDECHRTPVLKAVLRKDVECLKFLISANANLDIRDKDFMTVFSASLAGDGRCLEVLLETKRMFEDDGLTLKKVHRDTMLFYLTEMKEDAISFKTALLLIKHKVFDWDWCTRVREESLKSLMFGAVASGLSPGKIRFRRQYMSPLIFAINKFSDSLVSYLLANLYFLPDDYDYLLFDRRSPIRNFRWYRSFYMYDDFLLMRLTHEPLPLQTWSVLAISERLEESSDKDCCAFKNDRYRKVDTLPLPESLKDILKFKAKFSRLCVQHWKYLGPSRESSCNREHDCEKKKFDEISMSGDWVSVSRFTLEKCTDELCLCAGVGVRLKPVNKATI